MFSNVINQWKNASFLKKFVLVNILIPWTPIILLVGGFFAPPDVMDLVTVNGKLAGQVVGSSFQLASHFFTVWAGF